MTSLQARLLLVLTIALLPVIAASGEHDKLWAEVVQGNPSPRILDDFEVIEGMLLLRAAGDIQPHAAAFASVAFETGGPGIGGFALTKKNLIANAAGLKNDAVTSAEQEALGKLSERAGKAYGDRPPAPYYGTFMQGNALALQMTIKDAKGVEECLERMARLHGWVATLEKSGDCGFEKYKEAIDKHIPILLVRGDEWLVCFAYLRSGGKDYVVLANPKDVPLEKGGFVASARELEAAKTDSRIRRALEARKQALGDQPTDFCTSASKPLLKGMWVEPFEKGRYQAYFIYGWHVSAEAWRKEIEEIVGPPKDK